MITGTSIFGYLPPLPPASDIRFGVNRGDGVIGTLLVPTGADLKQILSPVTTSIPTGFSWTLVNEFIIFDDPAFVNFNVKNDTLGNVQIKVTAKVIAGGAESLVADYAEVAPACSPYPIPTTQQVVARIVSPRAIYSLLIYAKHDAGSAGNVTVGGMASATD